MLRIDLTCVKHFWYCLNLVNGNDNGCVQDSITWNPKESGYRYLYISYWIYLLNAWVFFWVGCFFVFFSLMDPTGRLGSRQFETPCYFYLFTYLFVKIVALLVFWTLNYSFKRYTAVQETTSCDILYGVHLK